MPNVVLIVIDTLRPDHLGMNGHSRRISPNLDSLAAEAVVFENWYANAPWTKPSVASLFTSLWPPQHGADQETSASRLAESLISLPEALREAGYVTAGFSENPHVGRKTGFAQGFDSFENRRRFASNRTWVLRHAQRWFRERSATAPFFLYLHFLDPHGPYTDPDAADLLVGLATSNPAVAAGRIGKLVHNGELVAPINPSDVRVLEALYDAEIRGVDRVLARVFALLRREGVWDETIVVVTSDHGEEFLDHGSLKHGYSLYEEALHVPMIWRIPGTAGSRVDAFAQHVDFAPTLLDRLGIEAPHEFRGRSLVALLSGNASGSEIPKVPVMAESTWRGIDRSAVRDGRFKLIVDARTGRRQLFDLEADPAEAHDIAASEPERVARLEALLDSQMRQSAGTRPGGATGEVDPETERGLRAIGYLDGDSS